MDPKRNHRLGKRLGQVLEDYNSETVETWLWADHTHIMKPTHEVKPHSRHWLSQNGTAQVILGLMNKAKLRKSNVLIHIEGQSHRKQDRSRMTDTQVSPNKIGILAISYQAHVLGYDLIPVQTGAARKDRGGSLPCGRIWGTPFWVWSWSDQKDLPCKPVFRLQIWLQMTVCE